MLPLNAVLLRRHAANTLMPGFLRWEELEYDAHARSLVRKAKNRHVSRGELQGYGQSFGYSSCIGAAATTLKLLRIEGWSRDEVTRAQLFILDALDVVPLTAGSRVVVDYEPTLVAFVEDIVEHPCDPAFRDAVLRKWRSPAVSDVLRSRGSLQRGVAGYEQYVAGFEARRRADIEKIGLRECAWLSCDKVERTVREFKQCSGCRSVWYCSPEHQMLDWGEHRKTCGELDAARKVAAKEAAKGGAGGASTAA